MDKFDLTSFQKASEQMIATNDRSYQGTPWGRWTQTVERLIPFSNEQIASIIYSGSLQDKAKLSRTYFYKDGYYKQIILHYANLPLYSGILVPQLTNGKNFSSPAIMKRYAQALEYLDVIQVHQFCINCAWRALVDGCYYGVRAKVDKNHFAIIDLPAQYCSSRFKDVNGIDVVDFDVTYFDTILTEEARKEALAIYPEVISKGYKLWKKGKIAYPVVRIPSDIGVCFQMFDGRPMFLNVIPKIIEYDQSLEDYHEKLLDEIHKILVQKIPSNNENQLLFEPQEAAEIHKGTVGMLKHNKHVDVLTTYGDVTTVTSKTTDDHIDSTLDRLERNIYSQSGVSGEVFSTSSSAALGKSLANDLSLMISLMNKFATFITRVINEIFSNSAISFRFVMLPISHYNQDEYLKQSLEMAKSGYSAIIPALAMGISQKDLLSIKDLENTGLNLLDKLRPLSTSYTQSSSSEGGRPAIEDTTQKADITSQTQEAKGNN